MFPNCFYPDMITRETLELRDIVKSGVNIWDFDYPSYYKGDQKKAFEQKVLDHFWTRQIGQETVGRFLHYFRRTMREIMPYYIQRYESVDLMKDPSIKPLENYNMVEQFESERSESNAGTGTVTNSGSSNGSETTNGATGGATITNDTPQGTLSIPIATSGNVSVSHASGIEETRSLNTGTLTREDTTENETTSSESSTGSGTEKHKLTRSGNIGVTTYAQLLEGYRETFLNIDMEVIGELEHCFMGVY